MLSSNLTASNSSNKVFILILDFQHVLSEKQKTYKKKSKRIMNILNTISYL